MKKLLLISVLISIMIAGCSNTPSDSVVQTAIAQTELAEGQIEQQNSPTIEIPSTHTVTITHTLEPTLTLTSTFIPSPTPDIRIVSGLPEDYILEKEDLPDKYILYPGNSTPHNNSEILSVRGVENGREYLDATGRLGGWIIFYHLADMTVIAPEQILSYIVIYDSVEGPFIAKSPEWDWTSEDEEGIEILDIDLDLGDWNRVYKIRERQPGGEIICWYSIEFIYHNVWAQIEAADYKEENIRHDYVENAARAVLEKLENSPLKMP